MTRHQHAGCNRRDTMKLALAGGLSAAAGGIPFDAAAAAKATGGPEVWAFRGTDKAALMRAVLKTISENGGFGEQARSLALKINASWWRTPAQGANTHPALVDAFIKGCKSAGTRDIVMPDMPCDPPEKSFKRSGLLDVAEDNNVRMINLWDDSCRFKEVAIPGGKKLKKAMVSADCLDPDVLINFPVAKSHRAAKMTCAMKNWMGIDKNRKEWHRIDLPQCIADFSTYIAPAWTIVDATRVMVTKGPKGPGKLKHPNMVILSKDQVAADACAALLMFKSPLQVPSLKIADDMKMGIIDTAAMTIHRRDIS